MGNVLSLEILSYYHVEIIPLLTCVLLFLFAKHSLSKFYQDFVTFRDVLVQSSELTSSSLGVCVRFLAENPGFPNCPVFRHDEGMFTAFQQACFIMSKPLIHLMIHCGARLNPSEEDYNSPFLICVSAVVVRQSKDFSCLEVLLEAGCDINATYAKTNMTALHVAIMYNRWDLSKFLTDHGIDMSAKDADGFTAFWYDKTDEEFNEDVPDLYYWD